MKTFSLALLASLSIASANDESANYLNFIVQIHSDANVDTVKIDDLSPEGSGNALEGVSGSSVFQLWTVHRTQGTTHLLDEKIVSSYHPQAVIAIKTGDPYKGIPRTRVDQPFTVEYTMSGLVTNDPDVQDAAKSAILQHDVTDYAQTSSEVQATQSDITQNGTATDTRVTSIQSADLTRVSGEESFTILARPDYGVDKTHMLASAKVQIWPIARASMSGFDTSKTYLNLPDIHVDLQDLYPDSTTYIRLYKGNPTANPSKVHIINTSYVIIDDTNPQDRKFSISGSELGITESGEYTMEIIHETPFGADVLSQTYPLKKKNNIKVVGSLNSSD